MMPRTRLDDLNYALRELAELTNPPAEWTEEGFCPVRGDVSLVASNLLPELIFRAGLALPQLAQQDDGGVRIWWLSAGAQLTINIGGGEEVSVTAIAESDGRESTLFRHDVQGEAIALAADELAQVRAFLEGLGGPSVLAW